MSYHRYTSLLTIPLHNWEEFYKHNGTGLFTDYVWPLSSILNSLFVCRRERERYRQGDRERNRERLREAERDRYKKTEVETEKKR